MFSSLRLGRFFGISVYLHPTFWLIPLLVFLGASQVGLGYALFNVGLVFAVFACVVLHEYGHALTARRFGIATRDITLYPIGGVARLERLPARAWDEFWIAIAGPAVNVVLAVLLAGSLWLISTAAVTLETVTVGEFLTDLLFANCILAAFNLIPAFPMDGGRILRALLVPFKGFLRATEIATVTGNAFAYVFMLLGVAALLYPIMYLSWWLIPLGFFVMFMGRQELAMVRYRAWRQAHRDFQFDEEPVTVASADDVVVTPVEARAGGFTGYLWDDQTHRWVEWRNGQPAQGLQSNS